MHPLICILVTVFQSLCFCCCVLVTSQITGSSMELFCEFAILNKNTWCVTWPVSEHKEQWGQLEQCVWKKHVDGKEITQNLTPGISRWQNGQICQELLHQRHIFHWFPVQNKTGSPGPPLTPRKFHSDLEPAKRLFLANRVKWHNWKITLFRWFEEVALLEVAQFWVTKTGWPKHITYRQCLQKVCVQQFYGKDNFQIRIFWVFVWVKDNAQVRKLSSLHFQGFWGQKVQIFGIAKICTVLHKVGNISESIKTWWRMFWWNVTCWSGVGLVSAICLFHFQTFVHGL